MQNSLQVFQNKQFGQMRGYVDSGVVYLNLGDVARGLGFIKAGGTISVRTINRLLKKAGYTKKFNTNDFVAESVFYFLAMKADNPNAEDFQKWLACDVVPSIRQNGSYSVNTAPALPSVDLRQRAVDTRNAATSVYQKFIDYAYSQGDSRARNKTFKDYSESIYRKFTKLANYAAGIPKGHRKVADDEKQVRLKLVENYISKTLLEGMAVGEHFTAIESKVMLGVLKLKNEYFENSLPLLE